MHTQIHTHLSSSLISTSRHWPAGYSISGLYSLLPLISLPTFTYCFVFWKETRFPSPEDFNSDGSELMKASMTSCCSILLTLLLTVASSVEITAINESSPQTTTTPIRHMYLCVVMKKRKTQPAIENGALVVR